jgi:6,7-dimethyl-8-ribityllumazine synthase
VASPPSQGRSDVERVVVVVSRFNEGVSRGLLDGAVAALAELGYGENRVDVVWVPGAFELSVTIRKALGTGRYGAAVALGAVIRGETPHFDYICAETTRGLGETARELGIPVGFGLLTCDTLTQAMARAGGAAGNKGAEAATAALETATTLVQMDARAET